MRARIVLLICSLICWGLSFTLVAMASMDYRPVENWRHLFLWWGIWWALLGQLPAAALIVDHYASRNRESQRELADFVALVRNDGPSVRRLN